MYVCMRAYCLHTCRARAAGRSCVDTTAAKFIKFSMRGGVRFAELQARLQVSAAAAAAACTVAALIGAAPPTAAQSKSLASVGDLPQPFAAAK